MNTLRVNVRYRPIRIGWCIRSDDFAALRESWRFSTTMWGGRYNPIIAVDDVDYARSLVKFFRVDILWSISNDEKIKSFIKTFPHLPNPFFDDRLFVNYRNGKQSAVILDIYHPIRSLYKKYFENNPNPKFKVILYEWDQKDPLSDIWLATFGSVPSHEITGTNYLELIEKQFAAERITIKSTDPWPIEPKNPVTLFSLGQFDVQRLHDAINGWEQPGFYLGSVENFQDLVNYWNLRASDIDLRFFDTTYANRFDTIRTKWLETLRARPKGRFESDNDIAIWSKNRELNQDLSAFGDRLLICNVNSGIWNGLNVKAPYMYFSKSSALATIGISSDKPRLSFQLPPKPFSEDRATLNQHLVISTDLGVGLFSNERTTLETPYIPELNEFYGRNCYFDWNKVRVEPDAIGIISPAPIFDLSLDALDVNLLIQQIFRIAGIVATPSKPGLIASRLIQQMGGLQECRPFKINGVRRLLEQFSPDQSFTHSQAQQTIRKAPDTDVDFQLYENLYIEKRPPNIKLKPEAVFSFLLKKNIFRAGLEFDCPSCRLKFWTALDNLSNMGTCAYCGHLFNITPYLKDRGDWRFRRTGLFGRNDNQEGAIAVMLTLQQLKTTIGSSEMLYTTAMELQSDTGKCKKCETDFVAIVPKLCNGRIQIAIGECKTRKAITEDDISKLISVAEAFSSDRFSVFIILAKLSNFNQDEINFAKRLNDQHQRRAILLTTRELEPYFLYERTAKEFKIDKNATSYEDMANVTHYIYFEPSEEN